MLWHLYRPLFQRYFLNRLMPTISISSKINSLVKIFRSSSFFGDVSIFTSSHTEFLPRSKGNARGQFSPLLLVNSSVVRKSGGPESFFALYYPILIVYFLKYHYWNSNSSNGNFLAMTILCQSQMQNLSIHFNVGLFIILSWNICDVP